MKKLLKLIKAIIIFLFIVILSAIVIFCYSRYIEPNMLTVKKYEVNVPDSIPKCKVVFFSDTHFGKMYDQKNIEKIVENINSQNPDIVVFGGDFIDNYGRDHSLLDLEYLVKNLASINANYGKYAVLGNHDYGGGSIRIYEDLMESGGFTVIEDDNEFIEELNIRFIGYDDLLLGNTDSSLYTVKNEDFNIILSHEPDRINSIKLPENGLMLSGHSHGGQITLPYITNKILPEGAKEYVKGKYNNLGVNSNIDLFVSSGIGMSSLPFRFLNIPQIMVLDLQS